MAIISGIYKIVDKECTQPQIAELLKKYKDINEITKGEIRHSLSKQGLIENLQRVVSLNLIPKSEVYDLIQQSEENGEQHIYYYRPQGKTAEMCAEGTEIANALFGESWGVDYFPQFERRTEKLKWADFRLGFDGKGKDWVAKLYGHERILRLQKREKVDITATGYREILDYEAEDYNTVLVVRWNHPRLLEVRIDQTGMQKAGTAESRLESVWEEINKAIPQSDCTPWDLRKAITYMLVNRTDNHEVYDLGTVRLLDASHGGVQFDPFKPTESIDGDAGRTAALNDLLKSKAQGTRAAITWKTNEECKELNKSLLTIVTGEQFNCLVVSSKTSASVLDYVTNKLRKYSQ
jgi:hypothetical protein